ncbi:MAG TPA: DUF6384 family protein [Hyphomonadaceae bacterium]|nr:DUF6384 family protein [Hyphomonadaceae bacterium]
MSDTAVPARPAAGPPAATGEPRKLDDVLLAMDVVDTLRHRVSVVDAELNAEKREQQLIDRLKEIYGAQGISVPEKILKDGVKALEEQRFVYKPPENTFSVKLAKLYVSRRKWLPAAMTFTGAIVALVVGWQVFWAIPQANEWRGMPAEIARLLEQGQGLAVDPAVDAQLASVAAEGQRAVANNNHGSARTQVETLKAMNEKLAQEYDVRIVSRPDEDTGFWRQSNDQPNAMNYYLVVEAVAPGGRILTVPITSIETQKTERVNIWAQRVAKDTFDKTAAEKSGAGGVITNDILGHKARGELEPRFDVPVPGGAITKWDD